MITHENVLSENVSADTSGEERVWIEEARQRKAKYIVVVVDDFFIKGERDPEYAEEIGGVAEIVARTGCDRCSYVDYVIELC